MRPSMAGKRLFMVLQAFIDESYEQDGFFVLAGYVSTVERWADFSVQWTEALKSGVRDKNGDFHFKMRDMASPSERLERVSIFHNIIQTHVLMSMSLIIRKDDLERAAARISAFHLGKPVKIAWRADLEPYYVAFHLLMMNFHHYRLAQPDILGDAEPVDFYFDEHSQKKKILASWDEYVAWQSPEHQAIYGSTPQFRPDNQFLPLQAADFLAWWVRKWAMQENTVNIEGGQYSGFVPSNMKIPNLKIAYDEDVLVEFLSRTLEREHGVLLEVKDRGPGFRVDETLTAEQIARAADLQLKAAALVANHGDRFRAPLAMLAGPSE
jgi:hypothetical protein